MGIIKNMNNKMATYTYLSTIESKKQNKETSRTEIDSNTQNILTVVEMDDKGEEALAGVVQWIECRPANQRVACSIPSQGTCLGC